MTQPGLQAVEIDEITGKKDLLAEKVADLWNELDYKRQGWLSDKKEIIEYVLATSTYGTGVENLGWKNSTHIPKICQIRDNLHANYKAALFANDRPIRWEGEDKSSQTADKRRTIESYMYNKLRLSGFRKTVDQFLYDYIDYGNVFATVDSIYEYTEDPETGQRRAGFIGPKAVRISPVDIVFNPAAASFDKTPKIIRSLVTLASLKSEIEDKPHKRYFDKVFDKLLENRSRVASYSSADEIKNTNFSISGFQNWYQYFMSDFVEVLELHGDIYDPSSGKLLKNHSITVVDRMYVIRDVPNPSWHSSPPIFHAGWRIRPDNLIAMGPLDNLIGMQYRINHLENAKADAYDLIIHPVQKVRGFVEDYEYGPGEKIYVGDEGDVEFMSPDVTMLSADTQIQMYEAHMEEMSGAPKQAMGFRTPGEKTRYEVQVLENGANRIFLNKISYFEEAFLEPLLNAMLISARENVNASDLVRVVDDDTGVVEFMSITKEDLTASGKIYPIGARHFARDANLLQSLTELSNSGLMQDAAIKNHFSSLSIAKLIENLLGLERFNIVSENVRLSEDMETAQLMESGQNLLNQQQPVEGGPLDGPRPADTI